MQKRVLGNTGEELSVIGFGGIIVKDEDPKTAEEYVSEAIDAGVNYFDVAPSYGNAQERLGPALKAHRSHIFLACKTEKRDAAGLAVELEESLKKLETDHIDLYQFHAVSTMKDVERIFGPGGALEAAIAARKAGKIRFIGFSAHAEEPAVAMMNQFAFTSVLFPVNWACLLKNGFGKKLMEAAVRHGTAILALKTLAKRALGEDETRVWPKSWYAPVSSYEEARLAVRFTLSQPVTAAVSPGHIELFRWIVKAESEYEPLQPQEEAELREKAAGLQPIFPK